MVAIFGRAHDVPPICHHSGTAENEPILMKQLAPDVIVFLQWKSVNPGFQKTPLIGEKSCWLDTKH
jgi:hypothetical protein